MSCNNSGSDNFTSVVMIYRAYQRDNESGGLAFDKPVQIKTMDQDAGPVAICCLFLHDT